MEFTKSLYASISVLSMEERGELLTAILAASNGESYTITSRVVEVAFAPFKNEIDAYGEKVENIACRNRINGSKGGRPKKTQENPKNPENPVGYLGFDKEEKDSSLSPTTPITSAKEEKKESIAKAMPKKEDDASFSMGLWNDKIKEHNANLPRLVTLSDKRRSKIDVRIREFAKIGGWKEIMAELFDKVALSNFCQGDNKSGWKVSFDWLFDNSTNWVKVYEGQYDNPNPPPNKGAPEQQPERKILFVKDLMNKK